MTEEQARKRVKKLKGFYSHASSYVIVNGFLFSLSMYTGGGWWVFPALGWGIGLAFHALGTFEPFGNSKEWEEREVKRLMRAEQEPVSAKSIYNMLDERLSTLNAEPVNKPDALVKELQTRVHQLEQELKAQKKSALLDELTIPDESEAEKPGKSGSRTR